MAIVTGELRLGRRVPAGLRLGSTTIAQETRRDISTPRALNSSLAAYALGDVLDRDQLVQRLRPTRPVMVSSGRRDQAVDRRGSHGWHALWDSQRHRDPLVFPKGPVAITVLTDCETPILVRRPKIGRDQTNSL